MSRIDRLMADLVTVTDSTPRTRLVLEVCVVSMVVLFLVAYVFNLREPVFARTQTMEAFTPWLPARADMVAWRAERGQWPRSAEDIGSESLVTDRTSDIARGVELGEGGALTVVFGNEAPVEGLRGRRLSFRPALPTADPGAPVIWTCGSRRVPEGFTPGGRDLSDLGPAFLPAACKDFPRP